MTKTEIQKCYHNEFKFNGGYSRANLLKNIKDGPYAINLDEYTDIAIQWMALYVSNNDSIYFDSLELNIFLKKSDILLKIETCKQIYLLYVKIFLIVCSVFIIQ